MGLRLRASGDHSPCRDHRCCLQASIHPGQDPTGTKISELNTIHSRAATPGPFILTSFLCTLQRWTSGECLVTTHFAALIPTLQHSIRSLWLRATPAGFPPACHQTISSSLMDRSVGQRYRPPNAVAIHSVCRPRSEAVTCGPHRRIIQDGTKYPIPQAAPPFPQTSPRLPASARAPHPTLLIPLPQFPCLPAPRTPETPNSELRTPNF